MNNLTATDVAQALSLQRRDSGLLIPWNEDELPANQTKQTLLATDEHG
jgi:hypothetical protein